MHLNKKITYKKLYYIAAALLLFGCLVTRLFRLDTIPSGMHLDEAGMAYDAWCLAHYGVDRYLISWPVYLNNFGGGQSILYAYLCAALFKIFGYSIWLVRLPAVVFSTLTVLYGMKLTRKLYPQSFLPALAAGVLLTASPYLVLIGRLGVDCFLSLGASSVFLYYFVTALQSQKLRYYILSGILGGILLYTYVLTYMALPIFLFIALLYTVRVKQFSFRKWFAMAIPMALLALPLILTQLISIMGWDEIHLGIFTCIRILDYRTRDFNGFHWQYLLDMLYKIFIYSGYSYCSVPGFPNLYYTTIPFFVIGLFSSLRNFFSSMKERQVNCKDLILLWFFIAFFLFGIVKPSGYRICFVFFGVVLVAVEGFHCVLDFCKNKLPGKAAVFLPRILPVLFALIYLAGFLHFAAYYYLGAYTRENYALEHFYITVPGAIDYLREHPEYAHRETQLAEMPIYLALSTLDSPYELQLLDPQNLYILDYFHCSHLGEIEDDVNYIVRDIYVDYSNELRASGFTEINYGNYSLFFKE